MSAAIITALLLSGVVGLTLGTLGGGGSVLTLPIFVFVAGISPKEAVPMSMVVVGGTSLIGALLHYRLGNFNAKAALLFGVSGAVGSYLGSYLTHLISERALLAIFAALMLIAGSAMLRAKPRADRTERCYIWRCLAIGSLVGGLTGFLGIGGGFVIVPALVLFAGIEPEQAVGTSLAVIASDAASGLVGHMQQVSINGWLTFGFLGLAILGMFGGTLVSGKITGRKLHRTFGWFIILLGLAIGSSTAAGVSLPSR